MSTLVRLLFWLKREVSLLMLVTLSVILSSPVSVSGAILEPEPEEPIFGEMLTEDNLENKLVLLVFWKAGGEIPAEISQLEQIKNWLPDPETMVIVGSVFLENDAELREKLTDALSESEYPFTVYENWIPEEVVIPENWLENEPILYLYRENGELEASGTPEEILKSLPESIKKQFVARAQAGFYFVPLEYAIVTEELEMMKPYFAPKRAWVTGFNQLETLIEDEEYEFSTDAQILRDQLLLAIYGEMERLENAYEIRPGESAYRVSLLCRNLAGMEAYEDASDLLASMKERKGISEMIYVYSAIESLKREYEYGRRPFRMLREAENVQVWLNTLAKSKTYDDAIHAEAEFMLRFVREKMGNVMDSRFIRF